LGRALSNVMMVAPHPGELEAVAQLGMRTAFVYRPREFGDHGERLAPGQSVDIAVEGIDELASALGV
jgi:2-haloacid dehalogenase